MENSKFLTDLDLEAKTGITRTTWQQWRHRGEGPAYTKFGTRVLYPSDSFEEFAGSTR